MSEIMSWIEMTSRKEQVKISDRRGSGPHTVRVRCCPRILSTRLPGSGPLRRDIYHASYIRHTCTSYHNTNQKRVRTGVTGKERGP